MGNVALRTLPEEVFKSIFVGRYGKIVITNYECECIDFKRRIH
jgi:hypothetical protein